MDSIEYGAGLTSQSACQLAEITVRQLQHWDRLKIVTPSVEPATGSGSRRRFSPPDILRLAIARELRDLSLGLDAVRSICSSLAHLDLECDSATVLVWDATDARLITPDHATPTPTGSAGATVIVRVGALAASLRTKLLTRPASPPPSQPTRTATPRTPRAARIVRPRPPSAGAASWGETW